MRRNGFTLIELLVALALSTIVVLLVHRVFAAVVDGADRMRVARRALDRDANARRWLTEALGSLAVGTPGGGAFEGTSDHVTFSTWLPAAEGGAAPGRVSLGLHAGQLVARVGAIDSLPLLAHVQSATFEYLLDPGVHAQWVREWISPVTAPLAVRVRLRADRTPNDTTSTTDTLLLLIGPRG